MAVGPAGTRPSGRNSPWPSRFAPHVDDGGTPIRFQTRLKVVFRFKQEWKVAWQN